MQTHRLLIAALSLAVLGGVTGGYAADLGTTNAIPSDQIKKKIAPANTSPAGTSAGKALNTSPGNEQALRNAAQPNVPASGAATATIPQAGVQTQQLPEADLSGMRRTDGSSPPAGPFGSINDHRPPVFPDARDALNTSPRNEQILRDANRPDLPQGAVPGLSLPGTPTTIPGESTGTTSRENKGSAGGTSGLNNASALGNANAQGLNQGVGGISGSFLLKQELLQGTVIDNSKVPKDIEEARPLKELPSFVPDALEGGDTPITTKYDPLSGDNRSGTGPAMTLPNPSAKAQDRESHRRGPIESLRPGTRRLMDAMGYTPRSRSGDGSPDVVNIDHEHPRGSDATGGSTIISTSPVESTDENLITIADYYREGRRRADHWVETTVQRVSGTISEMVHYGRDRNGDGLPDETYRERDDVRSGNRETSRDGGRTWTTERGNIFSQGSPSAGSATSSSGSGSSAGDSGNGKGSSAGSGSSSSSTGSGGSSSGGQSSGKGDSPSDGGTDSSGESGASTETADKPTKPEKEKSDKSTPREDGGGWDSRLSLIPGRPKKSEPRGPLVSPADPDQASIIIEEGSNRRTPEEMKAMVTQPGVGDEREPSGGGSRRDPWRFAQPPPDRQGGAGGGSTAVTGIPGSTESTGELKTINPSDPNPAESR